MHLAVLFQHIITVGVVIIDFATVGNVKKQTVLSSRPVHRHFCCGREAGTCT